MAAAPSTTAPVVRVTALRPAPDRSIPTARARAGAPTGHAASAPLAVAAGTGGPAVPAPCAVAVPVGTAAVGPAITSAAGPTGVGDRVDVRPTGVELLLDGGRRVPLVTTVLVGRNPTPRAGEPVRGLVAVDDPARSVSKTHLAVGVDDAGAWVVDRNSTNGTVVTLPDGQRILCVPERRVRLVVGASVRFGDHGFTLAAPDPDADPR